MPKLIENLPCPYCGEPIEYTLAQAGNVGECPSCGEPCRMPDTDIALLTDIRNCLRTIRNAVIVLVVVILWWILSHA
ncbi:MAG: hypothetical protein H8E66_24005 [Planctomycetes bacterium]|nr:hypothetical protein [Planctomycetota bacterium]